MSKIIEFKKVNFKIKKHHILKDIEFNLRKNEIIGLVGESGSGKSTIAKLLMKIYTGYEGQIEYNGKDINEYTDSTNYYKNIQMIYQDPFSALNPAMKIKDIILEPLEIQKISNKEEKLNDVIKKVGLSEALLERYPLELSGGQCQRVGIARSLLLNPEVLVLDESIASLDVSIQAQIINLLKKIQQENEMSMIFISHDLAMVKYFCDHILILHNGYIVEEGTKKDIFENAEHPYTQKLVKLMHNPTDFSLEYEYEMTDYQYNIKSQTHKYINFKK